MIDITGVKLYRVGVVTIPSSGFMRHGVTVAARSPEEAKIVARGESRRRLAKGTVVVETTQEWAKLNSDTGLADRITAFWEESLYVLESLKEQP